MVFSKDSGNDRFGAQRMTLLKLCVPIFDTLRLTWFLDGGTLLGAHRNGTLIASDDDVDTGVVLTGTLDDVIDELAEIERVVSMTLPTPYKCRMITSYALKLEIYDPTHGKYVLAGEDYGGANFHNVTVDMQVYHRNVCRSDGVLSKDLRIIHRSISPQCRVPFDSIASSWWTSSSESESESEPVSDGDDDDDDDGPMGRKTIMLEGTEFPCPADTVGTLECIYGYIGENAFYDKDTKMYWPAREYIERLEAKLVRTSQKAQHEQHRLGMGFAACMMLTGYALLCTQLVSVC